MKSLLFLLIVLSVNYVCSIRIVIFPLKSQGLNSTPSPSNFGFTSRTLQPQYQPLATTTTTFRPIFNNGQKIPASNANISSGTSSFQSQSRFPTPLFNNANNSGGTKFAAVKESLASSPTVSLSRDLLPPFDSEKSASLLPSVVQKPDTVLARDLLPPIERERSYKIAEQVLPAVRAYKRLSKPT